MVGSVKPRVLLDRLRLVPPRVLPALLRCRERVDDVFRLGFLLLDFVLRVCFLAAMVAFAQMFLIGL